MDRSSAILERFRSLYPKEIDLSLDRIRVLMAKLGHPEARLPPVIHVAGTNGKGSTTAFMRAMLEASGARVHVFTSPHLVRFHERIRLGAAGGGRFIDEEELADVLLHVEKVNAGAPLTHFESCTAAALEVFARHPADYVLLEVGLGGRYDATNLVDAPLATTITSISKDHEKFLGDTIEAIAGEKAGIIKRGRPVIVAPQPESVLAVIEAEAARFRAPVHAANRDWVAHAERGRLVYQDEDGLLDLPSPRLIGRHQFTNAGTAIATLRYGGIRLHADAIEAGLASVNWPARLQRLSAGALVDEAPPDSELWIDGGHNPGAGIVIAEAMADLEDRVARPLYLIVGMLPTKDPVGFFRPFAGLVRKALTVPISGQIPGRDPAELAAAAETAGVPATPTDDVGTALAAIRGAAEGQPPPRILICGSLYLAGAVLDANGTPPE